MAAIDPGLTWELDKADVSGADPEKLLLIGLGTGEDRLYATDTSARGSGFEALVPGARVELLAPANHFTAMPVCKPQGEAILAGEKDDPVCTDPAGGDRQAIHDRIIALDCRTLQPQLTVREAVGSLRRTREMVLASTPSEDLFYCC